MAWFQVSSRAFSDPRVMEAGLEAVGLWVRAGSWAAGHARSNGPDSIRPRSFIPSSAAKYLGKARQINALVRAGLWSDSTWGGEVGYEMAGENDLWRIVVGSWRQKIPEHTRRLVMARDNYACVECDAPEDLTLDHIFPWSLGGSDKAENLRVLCRSCNSSKGARV